MKNTRRTMNALLFTAISFVSFQSMAQRIKMPAPSPQQTITQQFGLGEVTIDYSRPGVKDRTIFGGIVPYGKIWRTGANASTKLTFTQDVELEGHAVKAGTYALYSIPNKDSWEFMLYSDLTLGGNVAGYDNKKEVLRFEVKPTRIPMKLETLMINMGNITPTSGVISLLWENVVVSINVTTEIDEEVMKGIETSMASENPDYYRAAGYYYDNDKDLNKALSWINKATEANPEAFYMMFLKAKIEYKLGDNKAGKASAQKTIELANTAKNDDYVALAKGLMADNK